MYRHRAFDLDSTADLHSLIDSSGPAHLVSLTAAGLTTTVVPLLLDRNRGPLGTLVGHLARASDQWRDPPSTNPDAMEALAIFPGPDAYVSPSWYPSKHETGRVVPTWNYVVVTAHGPLVAHDDRKWVEGLVRRLTATHESGRAQPWSVDDAPVEYTATMLRQIVGIEIPITRLEGKRKLSQNRSPGDVAGVVQALATGTAREREVAEAMRLAQDGETRLSGC